MVKKKIKYIFLIFVSMIILIPNVLACTGSDGCTNCGNSSAEIACKQSSAYQQYLNSGGTSVGGSSSSVRTNNGEVSNSDESTGSKTNVGITMKDESSSEDLECGIFSENTATGKYLHDIYNIIKFATPIILLALSIVDFVKAIINDNSDELKKATTTFSKRLIVAIIILIVPTILNFVLEELFGIENCFKF